MSIRGAYHQDKSKRHGSQIYTAADAAQWRQIRKDNNFTIKELAKHIGVDYGVVQRIFIKDAYRELV